jgi:uncharacterized membrane protein
MKKKTSPLAIIFWSICGLVVLFTLVKLFSGDIKGATETIIGFVAILVICFIIAGIIKLIIYIGRRIQRN